MGHCGSVQGHTEGVFRPDSIASPLLHFVFGWMISAVADFPSTATIAEVNANSNLILFCRNCHWEFDHKLLKLGSVGFEPTTLIL